MIPRRARKIWPVLLIAAAVLFFFRQPVLFGKSFCIVDVTRYPPWRYFRVEEDVRANNHCNDQVFAHYPRKAIYRRAIQEGHRPQWLARMMGGYPLSADPHFGWYDPFNLILAVFSVDNCLKIWGFLQWFLGGVFTYLFLRELGLGRAAGVFGGIAFIAQPFFITHLVMPTNLQSAIWLPYLLWIFERMVKSARPLRRVPAMALGVALSILGGFPPAFILVLTSFPFYGVCRVMFLSKTDAAGRRRYVLAAALIVSVIVGALLAGPQLLPTYRLSRFSERKTIPYEEHKRVTLPLEFIATLANPYILGRAPKEGWSGFAERIRPGAGLWVSPTSFHEDCHYVGWAVLLLAIFAIRFRWWDRRVAIMAVIAALALITLYGAPTLWLAYHLIPGFSSARPDRIIFIWGGFMAFLAGVGLDELLKGDGAERKRFALKLLAAVLVVAIVMAAAGVSVKFFNGWIREHVPYSKAETGRLAAYKFLVAFAVTYARTWFVDSLSVAFIAAISAVFMMAAVRRRRMALLLFLPLLIDANAMSSRYLAWQPQCYPDRLPPALKYLVNQGWDRRVARFTGRRRVLPFNSPLIWGLSDAQGREALLLKHWGRYFDSIEPGVFRRHKKVTAFKNPASLASPLINAAGIKYLLSDVPNPFPPSGRKQWKLVHAGDLYIYENMKVFPEAWVAKEPLFVRDERQAARLIAAPGFDPALQVVIEGKPTEVKSTGGRAEVIRYSDEKVEVRLSEGAAGWLVLADTWYPAWKAYVDGKPRRIFKADLAFRAVKVERGDRRVIFLYRDMSAPMGWLLAGVGVLVCLMTWLVNRERWTAAESR